jgi:hypothetical protein
MAQADLTPVLPEAPPATRSPLLSRGLALIILVLLLGFIVVQAFTLWREWRMLRAELDRARHTTVIGYLNINPNPSYAASPKLWFRDEGEFTFLWSGWKPGIGHGWFKVGRGEVAFDQISGPMGRDVIQAIDWPVVEVGGGQCWEKIPWDAEVAGLVLDGITTVYPMLVLKKVEVVNDQIDNRPVLITFRPDKATVSVFDPMHEGRRLTLGLSGYFFEERHPVLYDRATESLWQEDGEALVAFAGKLKGTRLARIGQPDLGTWGTWRSRHPKTRLIVGGDRSKGLPKE